MSALALLAMSLGTLLLVIAAIGVVRLSDSLQRMHAATKAGTLGATLVLGGAAGMMEASLVTAGFTVLFLLLTLPIGAQLLSRAVYVSGATLHGVKGQDPLAGILSRQSAPLEERSGAAATNPADPRP